MLEDLDATLRYDDRGLKPNASHLQGQGRVLLVTSLGPLDVLCELGDDGYRELIDQTVEMDLGAGYRCRVLSLAKLIEVKEASGREKDKLVLPTLRAALGETQRSGS